MMPRSQQPMQGQQAILDLVLIDRSRSVVDVGAGSGHWGELLTGQMQRVDAIEVWEPYVRKFALQTKYDEVIVADARQFHCWDRYGVVILGDVLEHMPRGDAVAMVNDIRASGAATFLTIPVTLCVQDGRAYGNPYETHVEQWTHKQVGDLGFEMLHCGPNPNDLVLIGTYILEPTMEPI